MPTVTPESSSSKKSPASREAWSPKFKGKSKAVPAPRSSPVADLGTAAPSPSAEERGDGDEGVDEEHEVDSEDELRGLDRGTASKRQVSMTFEVLGL